MSCKHIIIDENSSAFVCGGKQDHECDSKLSVYGFSDGDSGTIQDKAKKEKIYFSMCEHDLIMTLNDRDIHITWASVACSICGRAAIDDMLNMGRGE